VGAEIALLLLFPRLEGRFSLGALFAIAFAGTSLRWLLVSRAGTAAALVGLQALHGLTFGLFWGAAVKAMSIAVPSPLRATGQALFSAVVFAGGNAVGYALSGAGYDRFGSAAPLFAWAAALELVPLAMVLAFARRLAGSDARTSSPAGPPSKD
jgi:PPP family 3-phenylpropionic acid transporter